jgi:hypothetical protein
VFTSKCPETPQGNQYLDWVRPFQANPNLDDRDDDVPGERLLDLGMVLGQRQSTKLGGDLLTHDFGSIPKQFGEVPGVHCGDSRWNQQILDDPNSQALAMRQTLH